MHLQFNDSFVHIAATVTCYFCTFSEQETFISDEKPTHCCLRWNALQCKVSRAVLRCKFEWIVYYFSDRTASIYIEIPNTPKFTLNPIASHNIHQHSTGLSDTMKYESPKLIKMTSFS